MKSLALYAVLLTLALPALPQGADPVEADAPESESRMASTALLRESAGVLEAVEDVDMEDTEVMPGGGAGPVMVLNVEQCVETALAQNGQVLTAVEDAAAARARVGQAKAARLPQVSARSAFTRIEELPYSGGALGAVFGGGLVGERESRTDQLIIEQVVYAGGQINAGIKASEYLARSAEWQKDVAVDELTFETRQAFYDCLQANALVAVAEESVVTFRRHLSDAQQMFDVGMISNFEVLRAKTELGARNADLVAARSARRLAYANLKRLLAVPQDTRLQLEGALGWIPLSQDLKALVDRAWSRRPELLALGTGLKAAEREVRRKKGQFLPQVGATADWTNQDGGGAVTPEGWTFTLGVQLDIYTGNRRAREVAEARAQERSLTYELEDVKRLVELDVHRAYIQVQDAIARIKSEKGTVELGEEGLRLAELRFQEGVGTQADILDAQLALTNAQSALVRALREYAVAHAALEKATGGAESAEETS
jgi:outer membrane protein TolC